MNIIFKIALLVSILPIVVLPLFSDFLPKEIPAFINYFGNPTLMMKTTSLSILRLPLMGITLQIVYMIMYSLKLTEDAIKDNQITWSTCSIIVALKMSITSFEIFIVSDQFILNSFRWTILILVIIGEVVLIKSVYNLYKQYKGHYKDYYKYLEIWKIRTVFLSLSFYIILVSMPFILK